MTMREGEYLSALYVCCSEQTDRNLLAAMQETAGGGNHAGYGVLVLWIDSN